MNKFLILTANLGGKDNLIDPPEKFSDCDYIAIVDKKYNVDIWDQFGCFDFSNIDNFKFRRNAKLYKVLTTLILDRKSTRLNSSHSSVSRMPSSA